MLGPAHGIHDGSGLVIGAGGCVGFVNLQQIRFRGTGNFGNHLEVITVIMFFQKIDDAPAVLQGQIP